MSPDPIAMAARLMEIQRVQRSLYGDRYDVVMEPYREVLRGVGGEPLAAAVKIARDAEGFTALRILAAAVDLSETARPAGATA